MSTLPRLEPRTQLQLDRVTEEVVKELKIALARTIRESRRGRPKSFELAPEVVDALVERLSLRSAERASGLYEQYGLAAIIRLTDAFGEAYFQRVCDREGFLDVVEPLTQHLLSLPGCDGFRDQIEKRLSNWEQQAWDRDASRDVGNSSSRRRARHTTPRKILELYDRRKLGRLVKAARVTAAKSQESAAEGFRVKRGTWGAWERGERLPHLETMGELTDWITRTLPNGKHLLKEARKDTPFE